MSESAPLTRAKALRRPVTGLVAIIAVACVGSATARAGMVPVDQRSEVTFAAGDRVLQSVNVAVAPDGTLTTIDSTTVTSSAAGSQSDATDVSYSPESVVGSLPVSILTSYRTADASGTDLSDLAGYTGPITIDLTVQNLTVAPQNLSYDVDGASRSQAALVGAPLTIVASAALDGTSPASVVTDAGKDKPVTNGVLSQGDDGTTQVQWATILAPPQLSSSATLSLVVDAKDFTPPSIDLSVQPGLVTDPSVGALIDAAFNPAAGDELKLQSRTIRVIGEVNDVLAKASQAITKVRTTLESSGDTLGTQTVSDLKSSVTQISTSMKSLDGTVKGLGTDLSSTLRSTGSSSIQQLATTVDAVDTMLGDTNAHARPAKVTGSGCGAQVTTGSAGKSVYSSLLRVASTLQGYAKAVKGCKTNLQQAILASVGPADPNLISCTSPSVTCSLYTTETKFTTITKSLVSSGDAALAELDPLDISAAATLSKKLTDDIKTAQDTLSLQISLPFSDIGPNLKSISDEVGTLEDQFDAVKTAVSTIHDLAGTQLPAQQTMADQTDDLATQMCGLIGDGVVPGTIDRAKVEALRAYLTNTSCADAEGHTFPLVPPAKYGKTLDQRIAEATAAWTTVSDASDVGDTSQGIGQQLAAFRTALATVRTHIDDARASVTTVGSGTVSLGLGSLSQQMADLATAGNSVLAATTTIKQQQSTVTTAVKAAFQKAADDATAQITDNIDPAIRQVSDRSAADRESVGEFFDNSTAGLSASARGIAGDGKKALDAQRAKLAKAKATAEKGINANVDAGLKQVADGVGSSTRDTKAATTLLTKDLQSVLLDLGDRNVQGSGLLGALATNSATATSANFQVGLARETASSYANVRGRDVAGILLRQAQANASLERQAQLPAFQLDVPAGVAHRTVYVFHLQGGQ